MKALFTEIGSENIKISRLVKMLPKLKIVEDWNRKTLVQTNRQIWRAISMDPFLTINQLEEVVQHASSLGGTQIRQRIYELWWYKFYWASKKPLIKESYRRKRLDCAIELINWLLEFWKCIIWSDESPWLRNISSHGNKYWTLFAEVMLGFCERMMTR